MQARSSSRFIATGCSSPLPAGSTPTAPAPDACWFIHAGADARGAVFTRARALVPADKCGNRREYLKALRNAELELWQSITPVA